MRALGFAALVLALAPLTARAQETARAGVGGACGARADCQDDLRCFKQQCIDRETFESRSTYNSTRYFMGVGLGGVLAYGNGFAAGVQQMIHAGVLFGGHAEIRLEVSPATTLMFNLLTPADQPPTAVFESALTIGYLIPINDFTSWIVRIGGGGGAFLGIRPGTPQPFGELRLDVVGVAVRTSEHLLVEFNVPSLRVLDVSSRVVLMAVTNVGFNYLF